MLGQPIYPDDLYAVMYPPLLKLNSSDRRNREKNQTHYFIKNDENNINVDLKL